MLLAPEHDDDDEADVDDADEDDEPDEADVDDADEDDDDYFEHLQSSKTSSNVHSTFP